MNASVVQNVNLAPMSVEEMVITAGGDGGGSTSATISVSTGTIRCPPQHPPQRPH